MASTAQMGNYTYEMLLNTARWEDGWSKAAAIAAKNGETIRKQIQSSVDGISDSLKDLVGGLAAAFSVEKLVEFGKQAVESAEQVERLSQALGESTKSLQAYSYAAALVNTSLDTVAAGNAKLIKSTELAVAGSEQQVEALRAIGISATQAAQLLKDPDKLIQTVASHIASFGDGTGKTAVVMELFGKSAAELIPYLNSLGKNFDELQSQAAEFGLILSDSEMKALTSTGEAFDKIGQQVKGLGNEFAIALAPAAKEVAESLGQLLESQGIRDLFTDLGKAAKILADNLGFVTAAVDVLIAKQLTQWIASGIGATYDFVKGLSSLEAAFTAAEAAGAGILGVLGGLAGILGVGVGALYYYANSSNDAAKATDSLKTAEDLLNHTTADSVVQDIARAGSLEKLAQAQIDAAKATLANYNATLEQQKNSSGGGFGEDAALAGGSYAGLQESADALGKHIDDLQGKLNEQHSAVVTAVADFKEFSGQVQDVASSFKAGDIAGNLAKYNAGVAAIHAGAQALRDDGKNAAVVNAQEQASLDALGKSLDAADKSQVHYNASVQSGNEAAKAQERLSAMFAKDAQEIADAAGKLDPVQKIYSEYVKSVEQAVKAYNDEIALIEKYGLGADKAAQALTNFTDKRNADIAALDAQVAAQKKQNDVVGIYLTKLAAETATSGLTERQQAQQKAIAELTIAWNKLTDAEKAQQIQAGHMDPTNAADKTAIEAAIGRAFDQKQVDDFTKQFGDVSPYEKLTKAIDEVGAALDKAMGEGATDRIKELQKTIGGIRQSLVEGIVKSSQDGLRSLQSMTTQGSTAFKVMQIAIDALTVVQAISAILNQAQGDPYTAFARMAAMAAAVVALGVDIAGSFGGGGGPSAKSAAEMQKAQGTGTVLGDAKAQSDSIAKSVDITANATTQLVGLNRGMLNALNNLQAGLGAAGVQIARGASNVTAPALSGGFEMPGDPIGSKLFGALFGGKQKIIDQGITIAGGALSDMINSIAVGAYTTIHTSGGLFGKGKDKQVVTDITDEFGKQFSLVIKSIADTVKQGALALGLLPDDIQKALDAYQVAATNISLQGLSADDQQKALEAVFSSIFDGLAASVVPFVAQFQQVGEGLGETLVRIATEVQVTQEGFRQLGLSVSETDPEKFAQISDALIQAAGGIDDFISGMQSFVNNFSSDSDKLITSATSIASAFSQVGLTVPATRDGMWDLMKSLDATTDAGRAQIATLLRLSDASAAYYDQIDAFNKTLGIGQESDFNAQLKAIRDAAVGLVKALGAAGASTDTLQNVYAAATAKMQEVIATLQESAQELAFSLGLSTQGSLDQVNQEIAALEGQSTSAASSVNGFGNAIAATAKKASDAMNLLLGDLSPLNDQQKLQTALQGLRQGSVTADQVLEIGRRLYASSEAYTQLFSQVQQYNKGNKGTAVGRGGSGSSSSSSGSTNGFTQADLPALLAQRDTLQKAQTLGQFQTLAQQVAQLASAKGEDYTQILSDLGIKQADLEKGLGIKSDADLAKYISTIQLQTDSGNENTASIVDAINALPAQIAAAISGGSGINQGSTGPIAVTQPGDGKFGNPSVNPGTVTNTNTPPTPVVITNPGGNGGQGNGLKPGQTLTNAITEGVTAGVAPITARIDSSNRRNMRWANA